MNLIDIDKNSLNAKYLSDVSFSNNDYVLNTLLNLLPKKIYLQKLSNVLEFNKRKKTFSRRNNTP